MRRNIKYFIVFTLSEFADESRRATHSTALVYSEGQPLRAERSRGLSNTTTLTAHVDGEILLAQTNRGSKVELMTRQTFHALHVPNHVNTESEKVECDVKVARLNEKKRYVRNKTRDAIRKQTRKINFHAMSHLRFFIGTINFISRTRNCLGRAMTVE